MIKIHYVLWVAMAVVILATGIYQRGLNDYVYTDKVSGLLIKMPMKNLTLIDIRDI